VCVADAVSRIAADPHLTDDGLHDPDARQVLAYMRDVLDEVAEDPANRQVTQPPQASEVVSHLLAEADGNRTRLSRGTAHTGFEDLNSYGNVGRVTTTHRSSNVAA
jgi:hypothetical protein